MKWAKVWNDLKLWNPVYSQMIIILNPGPALDIKHSRMILQPKLQNAVNTFSEHLAPGRALGNLDTFNFRHSFEQLMAAFKNIFLKKHKNYN